MKQTKGAYRRHSTRQPPAGTARDAELRAILTQLRERLAQHSSATTPWTIEDPPEYEIPGSITGIHRRPTTPGTAGEG